MITHAYQNRPLKGRVGWLCTYVPEEIISAAGFEPFRILPDEKQLQSPDKLLTSDLCPYVRTAARQIESGLHEHLEGIVITNSCNAMVHLYNVLREKEDFFVYFLDVPRKKTKASEIYYALQLQYMAEFLENRKGSPVSFNELKNTIELYRSTLDILQDWTNSSNLNGIIEGLIESRTNLYPLTNQAVSTPRSDFNNSLLNSLDRESSAQTINDQKIVLTGALPFGTLLEALKESDSVFLLQENCLGLRYFLKNFQNINLNKLSNKKDLFSYLAGAYLGKLSCPRFFSDTNRQKLYYDTFKTSGVDGVIFHDLSFCDQNHYDYLEIKRILSYSNIPLLKIQSEMGRGEKGQIKTRAGAFLEMIN